MSAPANFDRLARAYRWLELLTFGSALTRCRERFLSEVSASRRALVLGDGDGRALAQLLRRHPLLTATAVDSSHAMLQALDRRCAPYRNRFATVQSDALAFARALPPETRFDLIVTHFFLDCLDQPPLDHLVAALTPSTDPQAAWLLSEFRIPAGWRGMPARLVVELLYRAFGLLTGLSVRCLPDHAAALVRAGWICSHREHRFAGLLTAELWRRQPERGSPL